MDRPVKTSSHGCCVGGDTVDIRWTHKTTSGPTSNVGFVSTTNWGTSVTCLLPEAGLKSLKFVWWVPVV